MTVDEANRRPLFGLVLAGGRSRRMGRDKALIEQDGVSLLEHAFRLAEALTDGARVSVRADQALDPERRRFPQVVDGYSDIGPVAGILSALQAEPEADWLVIACDLPNLDRQTLSFLIEQAPHDALLTAYRSAVDGLPEPLCAIYRLGSEALIAPFVERGIFCPRKILIRNDAVLLDLPESDALRNVNTPEELAASRRRTAS
jgi:molybdopterin-guanine dinucleotide biosynthesis protein A